MGYQIPGNTNTATAPTKENWKSDAFINIYLPSADGENPRKIGAIGLKLAKAAEAELIAYLQSSPEAVEALMAGATYNFRMGDGSSTAGFALPEVKAA